MINYHAEVRGLPRGREHRGEWERVHGRINWTIARFRLIEEVRRLSHAENAVRRSLFALLGDVEMVLRGMPEEELD